ncbi:glycosyltransferase [Salinimicrobium oceani]|uniref:Glycosyltransferase n=1 Tax=Salinimicrobium oceani TaxID=2722702 RepID=A0ABX1D292_9FLAO|nr:glycosyltransferase [Salinimicrobium oceani]NJW53447.1 glycosyltransferase [Salinimicrobium oceani]
MAEEPENQPKVSVVMITYGHELFIRDAVNGVLEQQCEFELEFIIANDCSPDATDSIIKTIIQENRNHPIQFKYIRHSENIGAMQNFVHALRMARGEYVALCEGDDFWADPHKLQRQVNFLDENQKYVVTYHDATIVDELGVVIQQKKMPELYRRDMSQTELKQGAPLLTLTLCFRNCIQDELPYVPMVTNGDKLLISLLGHFGQGKFLENIGDAVYRVHSGGIWSKTVRQKKLEEKSRTLEKMSKFYDLKGDSTLAEFYRRDFQNHLKMLGVLYFKKGSVSKATNILLKYSSSLIKA